MMRIKTGRWFPLFTAMLSLCLLAVPTRAADDDDPPARAARLSYSSGTVSFEPAGTEDWVDAVVNRPMTTGDKLWADQDGRVEVRVGSFALRLGAQTGFSFLNLDDNIVQVRLTEGSLNVRVRRLDDNQTLEIDTPNLAFNVLRPGSYRIDVNENGDTTIVTVRDGQGEVTGGGSAYPVHAGDSATFTGTDQLNVDVEGYGDDDDFDRWTLDRDRRWDHSTSGRYVSDDVEGYEDLDENGAWREIPEYGAVWFPQTTVVGWAPYRYGHWVWISPWGWTWVDDAPWGFAPFHYGRWVVAGGVWGWVPSPPRPAVVTVAYVRPVYAPALVAWVGGPRFGVGVAVGGVAAGVAWFPLGPRDVFTPSYHVSERYVERVNVSNTVIVNRTQVTNVYNTVYVNKTVNVTNITYQNRGANNAVTATSQASFTSAQPVGRNMVKVDAREVASAPVAAMTPAVAPQQRSFTGAGAAARARPPANVVTRNVVAKTAPPPAPVPIAKQMQAVQANGGRPPAVSQIRPAQESSAARANVKVAAPAKQAALPPRGQGVSNRPGQPAAQSQQNNSRPANNNQPNQPAVQPNANRPANANPTSPNRPNPNQPANPNANNPNQENRDRVNPNQPPAAQPNAPAAANPNRPNPNRPPNTASNPNQPNPNRPTDNRQAPPAVRQNADSQLQQRQQQQADQLRQQQQQEHEKAEQQQAEQQQKLEQQKADDQKRQAVQRQQQQQNQDLERKHQQQQQQLDQKQQKEAQKQQPKEQQKPKDNKDKDKDKKDRPPSR